MSGSSLTPNREAETGNRHAHTSRSATYFRPESEAEHKRGSRGEDVADYCANCRQPYMDHRNGVCQEEAE